MYIPTYTYVYMYINKQTAVTASCQEENHLRSELSHPPSKGLIYESNESNNGITKIKPVSLLVSFIYRFSISLILYFKPNTIVQYVAQPLILSCLVFLPSSLGMYKYKQKYYSVWQERK